MKKTLKKLCALVLALAFCMAVIQTGALASLEKSNYVALGDSLSSGCALEGFVAPGYKLVVKEAYPYLFAQEIGANLFPMAYGGFRTQDIYFLLDETYDGDDYTRRRFVEDNYYSSFDRVCGGLEQIRADFKDAVTNADYISVTMGGNDMATFLGVQFQGWSEGEPYALNRPGYDRNSKLLQSKEYKEIEENVREVFTALGKGKELVELMTESLRYAYTGFIEYFDRAVGKIFELNPDVTLMINGLNNPADGVYLKNRMLNVGKIGELLVSHFNNFMKEKSKYADCENYLFVDIMGAEVHNMPKELLSDEFFALFDDWELFKAVTHPNVKGHQLIKDRMIERINVPYYDVSKEDAFYDAVAFVAQEGLMEAKEVHKFAPYSLATKGVIAAALYRAEGEEELESEISFKDVREGEYYKEAVAWAVENELMSGVTNKLFLPYAGVTRQNLALILWKVSGQQEAENEYKFYDSFLISKSAKVAMNWAVENGVLSPYGKFISPRTMATRAELAQALLVLYGE